MPASLWVDAIFKPACVRRLLTACWDRYEAVSEISSLFSQSVKPWSWCSGWCYRLSRNSECNMYVCMNIALRRFLHNHGNIVAARSPKPGLCPTLIFQSVLHDSLFTSCHSIVLIRSTDKHTLWYKRDILIYEKTCNFRVHQWRLFSMLCVVYQSHGSYHIT